MRFFAWVVLLAAFLSLAPPPGGLTSEAQEGQPSRQERLWQYRNLGKAYYENTVTQPKAIEEFRKALELAPDSPRERVNYALALLRNGKTEEAVPLLVSLQKDHPQLAHTWFNLGVYYKRQGEFSQALRQFEGHRERAPEIAVTHYNLGVLYRLEGRLEEAMESFRRAAKQEHTLAAPHFQLSNLYRAQGDRQQASQEMEIFRRLKEAQKDAPIPEDLEWSIHAEIYDPVDTVPSSPPPPARWKAEEIGLLQKKGSFPEVVSPPGSSKKKREASQQESVEFGSEGRLPSGRLRERGAAAGAAANRNEHEEAGSAASQPVRVRPASAAGSQTGGRLGGLLLVMNQEAEPMLLAWNSHQIQLYRDGFEAVEASGLASEDSILDVAAGDVDDDGRQDLAVVHSDGVRLLMNRQGGFEELPQPLIRGDFQRALWLDFDHDYDLDLFLFGSRSRLLRNQGEQGFADRSESFPFRDGKVTGAAFHDHVKDWEGMDLVISYADGSSALYLDQLGAKFRVEDLPGLPAGARRLTSFDVDNNGHSDLLFSTDEGLHLLRRVEDGYEASRLDDQDAPFMLADASNRGWPDLFLADTWRRNLGQGRFGERQGHPFGDVAAWLSAPWGGATVPADQSGADAGAGNAEASAASQDSSQAASSASGESPPPAGNDLSAAGPPLLVALTEDGHIQRLSDEAAQSNWIQIGLNGERNLRSAHHGEVEVKAGSLYQKRIYRGRPLHFGLGGQSRVDTVRITWPNGLIQNEPLPEARRRHSYREAKQLSGSCPMVFTWDGERFRFINDILGVAPLGASAGDGRYFQADHDEYIQIPGEALVEREGRLDVRLTEELREVAYLDQLRLLAVDHPADIDIYTSDRFKSPPFPEFRLFGVRTAIRPLAARHTAAAEGAPETSELGRQAGAGKDVLEFLLSRDARAVTPWAGRFYDSLPRETGGRGASGQTDAPADSRSNVAGRLADRGILPEHALELDFAPRPGLERAVLVMHGWLDWADASTFVHSDQTGKAASPPRLEVLAEDGRWRVLVEDLGAPAGKWKTIAVPIDVASGADPEDGLRLRIVTSWAVHWDEIFLSPDVGEPRSAKPREVPLAEAVLDYRGFSKPIVDPHRRQPDSFDYHQWRPWTRFNQARGRLTRLGRVDQLLSQIDDRFVIMGAGDELRLSFDAADLPPLPPGFERQYLLFADGWVKDGDLNTAHSSTVAPLPFHAMSGYPYGPDEHYPDTPRHRRYLTDDLTRPALRQFQPLTPDAGRASPNPQNPHAGGKYERPIH